MEPVSHPVAAPAPEGHRPAAARPGIEALIAGTVTLGVFVLGSVLITGGASAQYLLTAASAAVVSWRTVFYVVGLALVATRMSGAPSSRRRIAFVVVALIATVIELGIAALPTLFAGGGVGALLAVMWFLQLFAFGASASIGAIASGLATRGGSRPRAGGVATALLLLGGAGAALLLFLQYLEVYFTIWGESDQPSPGEEARYLITGGAALASGIAGIVVAAVRRRTGAVIAGVVVVLLTVVLAGVFAVPRDRWTPEPAPAVVDDDYAPCFGEGPNCVGG